MTARLVLVRHAAVTVRPNVPIAQWHLSPEGRSAAEALAGEALWEGVGELFSSTEPKAVATAQRIAAPRGLRLHIDRDLREVERPWVAGDSYRAHAERFLRGETLEGWEARDAARGRVIASVERAGGATGGDVAIISHGLLLTLLLGQMAGLGDDELVQMWMKAAFPDIAIIDRQSGRLERRFGE